MRKEIKMIVFIFVLMLGAFVYYNYGTSTEYQLDGIALSNIDALAGSESGNLIECIGTGSVDCPTTKTSTSIVIRPTGIIDMY